jgi:LysM repeat protein
MKNPMKRKSFLVLIGIAALCYSSVMAQSPAIVQYVNTYKFIAIKEMQRTGIPASIKLAQGILETEAGNSDLVKRSNNHFGIKCKNTWTGDKVYHDDDERGECFRSYGSAEDSYKDHSDFLKNSPRYAFLFDLDPEDYEGWARGLKKAGYATNPKYTQQLLKYIEDYDLQLYSLIALGKKSLSDEAPMYAADNNTTPEIAQVASRPAPQKNIKQGIILPQPGLSKRALYPQEEFRINDTKVLFALAGASLLAIAEQYDVKYQHLIDFNELTENEDIVKQDQLIFLQRKRRQGGTEFHIFQKGETVYDIAQAEGIRLENLVSYNQPYINNILTEGQKIYLQKDAAKQAIREEEKIVAVIENAQTLSALPATTTTSGSTVKHIVLSKETLYSIAKKYDVGVDQLRSWNSLQKDEIKAGQQLLIYKN